jgi:hypothetical protein
MFFFYSIIYSLIILFIERKNNIQIDFHPDVTEYFEKADAEILNAFIENPFQFLGKFYYVIVSYFINNIEFLIILNILAYSLTNYILYLIIKNIFSKKNFLYSIFILIVIFNPYRAHLAVHPLKDTLIILSFVFSFFSSSIVINFIFIFLGFMLRLSFYVYLPIFFVSIKKKLFFFIFIFLFSISLFYFSSVMFDAIENMADMRNRSFDNVYNFIDFDFPFAQILRGITWPVIRITGLAVLFHPFYFLFLLQSMALMYIIYVNRRYIDYRVIFFILPLIALAVVSSGYNTYLRYSEPVITLFSFWLAALPTKYVKNFKVKKKSY